MPIYIITQNVIKYRFDNYKPVAFLRDRNRLVLDKEAAAVLHTYSIQKHNTEEECSQSAGFSQNRLSPFFTQ